MKLSELTPCALCGGKIAPIFYRVRVEMILSGKVLSGKANNVTQTVPGSQADLLICSECFLASYWSQAYVAHGEEE